MMLKMILPLALAVLLGAPAGAQDAQDPYERFKLFNECRPMGLAFEEEPDLEAVGLTVDRMLSTAESRLRAARLYDADAETFLLVSTNIGGNGFSQGVEYYKLLYDAVSGETNYAVVWRRGSTGTHTGNTSSAGFLLQSLSEKLDAFILEYLRVNEAACFPVPPPPQLTR